MNRLRMATLATVSALSLALAFNAGNTLAQQKTLREQLVETWSLVSNDNIAPNGDKRQLFGPNPKGLTIYDADGWYVQLP